MAVCKGEREKCAGAALAAGPRGTTQGGWWTSNPDVQPARGSQAADFTARKHRPLVTKSC